MAVVCPSMYGQAEDIMVFVRPWLMLTIAQVKQRQGVKQEWVDMPKHRAIGQHCLQCRQALAHISMLGRSPRKNCKNDLNDQT